MKHRNRITNFLLSLSIGLTAFFSAVVMVAPAHAADGPVPLFNPLADTVDPSAPVQSLAAIFINLLFGIAGSVALAMYVWAGFLWLTSAGEEKKVSQGKGVMQWTTLGIIMMFAAYTLVSYLFSSFGTGAVGGGPTGPGGGPPPSGGSPNAGGNTDLKYCAPDPKAPGPCEPIPKAGSCAGGTKSYTSFEECTISQGSAIGSPVVLKDFCCYSTIKGDKTVKPVEAVSKEAAQIKCDASINSSGKKIFNAMTLVKCKGM